MNKATKAANMLVDTRNKAKREVEELRKRLETAVEYRVNAPEQALVDLEKLIRSNYYDTVVTEAQSIIKDIQDGHIEDDEQLSEALNNVAGESYWTCNNAAAKATVLVSDNNGDSIEQFGSDGLVEHSELHWLRLAYGAFRQDIVNELEKEGVDLNDPVAFNSSQSVPTEG